MFLCSAQDQRSFTTEPADLTHDGDSYDVVVRNAQGSVTSEVARILVQHGNVRVEEDLIVLYTFEEGEGRRCVRDVSNVDLPIDLTIENVDRVSWSSGGGVRITSPTRLLSQGRPSKIVQACRASGEITVEAWIRSDRVVQTGPARIVSISGSSSARNVMLGQEADSLLHAITHVHQQKRDARFGDSGWFGKRGVDSSRIHEERNRRRGHL